MKKAAKNRTTMKKTTEKSARILADYDLSAVSGGAFKAFVNFGDIKGESTDKDHKDWVQILS